MRLKNTYNKSRTRTLPEILAFLARNKPRNRWQITKALNKSYGNIHATIRQMLDPKRALVKVEYTKRSSKNPKIDVEYYSLTIQGLVYYFLRDNEAWKDIDVIAENYSDLLLVFKKWPFFTQKNLKEDITRSFRLSCGAIYREEMWRLQGLKTEYTKLAQTADAYILGCVVFSLPKDERKKFYGDIFSRIWQGCKEDPELKAFLNREIRHRTQFLKEQTEALAECEALLK